MKIIKAVLALALSSACLSAAAESTDSIHLLHAVPASDEEEGNRFIVKYKAGRRGLRARRKARELGQVVMSLARDSADVLILESEEEVQTLKDDDAVEYIEHGKSYYDPELRRMSFVHVTNHRFFTSQN